MSNSKQNQNEIHKIKSLDELEKFANQLIKNLTKSTIFLVDGDLGSGKTALAKKIGKALEINENEIKSPTFNLLKIYKTKTDFTFFHLDLYRIQEKWSFLEQELEEFKNHKPFIAYIEWSDQLQHHLANHYDLQLIQIKLKINPDNTRNLTLING